MITSLIIAFIITFIICLLVKIRPRDIVLVCGISTLLVLLLENVYNADKNFTNFMLNTKLPFFPKPQKNDFTQLEEKRLPTDCGYEGCPKERLYPKEYGEIIPEDMYNQEDCTTDGSCLQKADEQNLFPGFKNLFFLTKSLQN